jgi:hypothetical protein
LNQEINASTTIAADDKSALITAVDEGVQLMSDTQVNAGLVAAGMDATTQAEVKAIYADARTDAFKAGVAFLIFVGIVGLVLTIGLPNKMLVGEDEDDGAVTAVTPLEVNKPGSF